MKTGIKPNSAPHKKQQRAWTEQEIELLSERYYFEGASKSLQKALNHPAQSVRKKANALGLVYGGYTYWSKKDEQLMRDRYQKRGPAVLCKYYWVGAKNSFTKKLP